MENIPLLQDIVILMAISVPISIVLTRIGLPTVVGFLVTGVLIGPYGFALVTEHSSVELMSQIGIVLLLFTIGLEFSLARMISIRRESLWGGGLQVALTVLIVTAIESAWGLPFATSLLLGFVISLSSTAIVLKLLVDKGDINSAHGNLSVGILLFQDVAVVLMVLLIQKLGGEANASGLQVATGLGKSLVTFGAIVVAVMFLIPRIFDQVVRLKNREVFILTIVLVCLGTAWVSSLAGLSLAMGAFIAGLAISESEYSHQIVAEVIPFRDTFSALFFVSIGMLLDFTYFINHLAWLIPITALIISAKAIALIGVGQILRYPMRLSIIVGLNLAQIGEFSFILIKMGNDYSMLSEGLYQTLIAASIMSMAVTPFLYHISAKAAHMGTRHQRGSKGPHRKTTLSNHVIIVGYGLNGKNLSRVLKETGISHLVVDTSVDRVRQAKFAGHASHFGDASHPEILRQLGVERANMVVVAISDPISSRRIVKIAREMNPAVSILVRTRYIREVEELYRLGANQVIPEEFETSVEIFARVLKDYRVPGNVIQNQIDLVRQEGYAMFRHPSLAAERLSKITSVLDKSIMETFYVDAGSIAEGKTLKELDLRHSIGITVIAIVRGGQVQTNPPAERMVEEGDVLVLLGSHAELNTAMEFLKKRQ